MSQRERAKKTLEAASEFIDAIENSDRKGLREAEAKLLKTLQELNGHRFLLEADELQEIITLLKALNEMLHGVDTPGVSQ